MTADTSFKYNKSQSQSQSESVSKQEQQEQEQDQDPAKKQEQVADTITVADTVAEKTSFVVPSKNPLPLSATQEAQVRDIYYARVRAHCPKEIKGRTKFADCARNRTVTATWKCRNQRLNMNSCMVKHATQEEMDKARQEWFRIRLEKRKLKENTSSLESLKEPARMESPTGRK